MYLSVLIFIDKVDLDDSEKDLKTRENNRFLVELFWDPLIPPTPPPTHHINSTVSQLSHSSDFPRNNL